MPCLIASFASSTFAGVIRLAAPRWSSAPQREGYHLSPWPRATDTAITTASTATPLTSHARFRCIGPLQVALLYRISSEAVPGNLIYRRELPVMVAAFIDPGKFAADGKSNRQAEYDPIDDRYSRVIIDELLPRLYAEYRISHDPDRHGIAGWSSGAIAAFTVAWQRPDQFRKVLSGVGSFVNLAGGHVYPERVLASDRKPIRIFMSTAGTTTAA